MEEERLEKSDVKKGGGVVVQKTLFTQITS